MTRAEAIAELVRIWHSPHLDLILKARLGEVIDALKEKNRSDSFLTDSSDDCKESESKLDLISRQDAIKTVIRMCSPICDGELEKKAYTDCVVAEINSLPSAEAVQGEWIDIDNYYRMATCSHCLKVAMFEKWGEHTRPYNFCPNCGVRMLGEDGEA